MRCGFSEDRLCELAFGELEAGTSTGLAGFLALFHPWVTGEEALGLNELAVLWVKKGERAGDRMADRDSLGVFTATFNDDFDIELIDHVDGLERGDHSILEINRRKVFLEGNAVDDDFTGSFGDPGVSDGGLAATSGAFRFDSRHDSVGKRGKAQRTS